MLELPRGKTYESVVHLLKVSRPTVKGWAEKYKKEGLIFLADKLVELEIVDSIFFR